MDLTQYADNKTDTLIVDSFVKADSIINRKGYQNIMASISGGADSDIMLDLCHKLDEDHKIQYVWFDTSLEYQATKDHLGELERRYGVEILRQKPVKSIPACCRQHGQPFLSKFVSIEIERLQRHGFQWEDESYEVLSRRYDNCVSALKWWCNEYNHLGSDKPSRYSIGRNKWLKEFMIANPPWFPISSKCCHYAKKLTAERFARENGVDLSIIGVRKAEGGVRAFAYNGCFTANGSRATAEYRPLFWYTNATKAAYEKRFRITHSRCYTEYGMTRTGCAGCPYNRDIFKELSIIREFEPRLYQAVAFIFKDSYEYTRMYREFAEARSKDIGRCKKQTA